MTKGNEKYEQGRTTERNIKQTQGIQKTRRKGRDRRENKGGRGRVEETSEMTMKNNLEKKF